MSYEPGRKYTKEDTGKGKRKRLGYLREERVNGVPVSFNKLNSFLKEKKRDLALFVKATTEKCKCGNESESPVAMEVDDGGDGGFEVGLVEEADMGPVEVLANSEDEEYFTDIGDDEGDSD